MRHVENLIRKAMDRGDFDNLPGKGKPLDLAQDPLLDPLTSILIRILKDNGVSHPLIEARKAIEAETADARNQLVFAWRACQSSPSEHGWAEAAEAFRRRVAGINREVRIFNLKMPSPALHGLIINADDEIRCVTSGSNPAPDRAST